jgi:hypothetical protein
MKRELDRAWPARWTEGDSARLGDYLGGRLTAEAVARIYRTGPSRYAVTLRFLSETGDPTSQLEAAKRLLLEEVLPLVGAEEPTDCEPLE